MDRNFDELNDAAEHRGESAEEPEVLVTYDTSTPGATNASNEQLPESLRETAERARAFFDDACSENTRRSYASDFEDFATYCRVDAGGLSALPASPATLTLYITDLEGRGMKASTIQRRLAAISQTHRRAGYESPANNELVRETFKGIKRKVGTRRREAAPLTLPALHRVFEAMETEVAASREHNSESVRRAKHAAALRDRALLLVGFAAALRRGEISALLVGDVSEIEEGMKLLLRRSKTDQEGAGELVGLPYGSRLETCPVRSLRRWISYRSVEDAPDVPLFCSVDRHGKLGAANITPDAIHKLVKKRVAAAGFDPALYSGHSLRAGLPTTASGMGVGIESWMRQSRHKTFAVAARYARETDLFKDNAAAMIGM